MIDRTADLARVERALSRSAIVLVVGPRQAGKSTLARQAVAGQDVATFDLENPRHAERFGDPMLTLEPLRGLVVIDEAQHAPALFPVLRVLADRGGAPARFLVLGSASPELVGMASESLAGRVEIVELGGFRLADVGATNVDRLWNQGGLPEAFVRSGPDSVAWRRAYLDTFLTRDLGQLGVRTPAAEMRRFWTMLAHYHGQTWNGAELGRAIGRDAKTVRHHLDVLSDALVVRQLLPWFENVGKRIVKSPKVYVRDSGVLHTLLDLDLPDSLLNHPKVGASWEGFVVEQIAAMLPGTPLYFWGTQSGAELDLFFVHDGRRIGVEIKRTSTPKLTPSMRNAGADLRLDRLVVVYPGPERYTVAPGVEAIPVVDLAGGPSTLVG
jgi:predicted AAA+ superfamily ATPase